MAYSRAMAGTRGAQKVVMQRALLLAGIGLPLFLSATPAVATTMPLADLTPGARVATLGFSELSLHASADWGLSGIASGWSLGLLGGFDYSNPRRRDSNSLVAVRLARRIWGNAPHFTLGFLLSAGANYVDPGPAPSDPTEQSFYSEILPWVQPAVALSFRIPIYDYPFWFRATLGPVIGRFTAGVLTMPWVVPNFEFAYRYAPNQEVVVAGGYSSPNGLGWRIAY